VIQITDKLTTGAPHFVEMGHSQPTQLSAETAEKIRQVVIAANHAVGIQNGPSHTEVIVTAEGPKIVEIGARLGVDCITTHLVPLSTGVNMVENCIRIALGDPSDLTPKFQKGSAIRYFKQRPGKVASISGTETAAAMEGIRQVSIVHGVGETVGEINSSAARMGFVVAQSSDAKEAVALCEKAINAIEIVIE
jgi:biotin carboxylase